MLLMNELVNELLVEYGSMDKISAEDVQVNGLACSPVLPSPRESNRAKAIEVFFIY
jgi:hypothetical protein